MVIAGWALVPAGVVALVAGTALLVVGSDKIASAEAKCPDRGVCADPTAVDDGNDGIKLKRASYGVFAIGGAMLVGGAVLLGFGYSQGSDDAPATVGVAPTAGGAALWLHGVF